MSEAESNSDEENLVGDEHLSPHDDLEVGILNSRSSFSFSLKKKRPFFATALRYLGRPRSLPSNL